MGVCVCAPAGSLSGQLFTGELRYAHYLDVKLVMRPYERLVSLLIISEELPNKCG